MDSGIRSGQDVIKALALGAKGTFVGRAMNYGLGVGGEAGVLRALEIIRKEMDTTMALMGERDMVQEIQDARALQLRLQDLSQYGLRSDFQIEAGEDHMSVPFRIPTRVLDELISTRRF